MKTICMTGSPKSAGFSTKSVFVNSLKDFGFTDGGKITKKNNKIDLLVCDDLNSTTDKMCLAIELGLEIMTYAELTELFDIKGDL